MPLPSSMTATTPDDPSCRCCWPCTAGGSGARLIAALDDPQDNVRVNAATQLGVLRDPRAFSPLLALAQDSARDDGNSRSCRGGTRGAR